LPDADHPQIVVEKLTKNVNRGHLDEIFGKYGKIQDLDLPMNHQCMSTEAPERDVSLLTHA
jgi:hypothetical protein